MASQGMKLHVTNSYLKNYLEDSIAYIIAEHNKNDTASFLNKAYLLKLNQ